ncbi:phosphoribosylformimino-5-aminoimidazole carboxamide ribotide isomerase [Nautilia profundicola AmH]|uniref:1-(5-phosphoribosyl)-5-[(5-phosphoribosylamino)methylideneamino] imidazole-4-carboxamide isomerase n=1 Tax=Nautilia profundicola (strain ATCC BAA-1463 / DSM 18972 / AmH) TaxID=598659 RepID=HIS4_NAUPA|nr:1-(5-phosphoribosyl)-5-[(5-phosphoribosylamino)methylideneamino]imidazole-4-carboxamide isomerase [Nautilia profundicola]B9L7G2.1 RecName: Full=1-(5-phosphoribosyl)-5-[(5-phosphoribosylamino)methylideneamino] imidazole-4-carboxamide isomerase; AltName: Full=Phosphoribosylformimino-5-aminoimidazole carboxamide ribotide isomerase [Nautilia profundicola AmH]ACM93085.1 phosphoribosylformimino-5-aminoimidazole carboxamide ribotide isomerase [Nautilia profundicola AmH]
MIIFPAIDLKDGQAVRLTKGLMDSAKVYSNEPYELAKRFEEMGAEWLHIVDLNGAFAGEPKNIEQIEKIRKNTNLKIQLGGGIRDEDTIKRYLDLGINRLILGSIAAKNPKLVSELAEKYPIAVGIDAKDGFVAIDGWDKTEGILAKDLAEKYKDSKIECIIATDISKDGTLTGLNIDFILEIQNASQKPVIASGGVASEEDIKKVKENNIYGVIIGKAFYEGKIDLQNVLRENA